jgi:CDP-glucose 4,6-dehydratase
MTPEFWAGRRVFVTGHTGFKGAWLCSWLDMLGAETYGYALEPPTEPSLYEKAGVDRIVRSTIADIRDLPELRRAIDRAKPEIVLHLAAQSLVLRSYEDPVETYSTNVLGTVHVLEAVRRTDRPCTVVNVTTDKVYENKGSSAGYREDDELGGHDPYSTSKAGAELVARAYRDSFFPLEAEGGPLVSIATARAGNVIGGGDWTPAQLVPDAIGALIAGHPVALRHPDAVRPWQHVLDCLAGYLTLAERLHVDPRRYSGEWNFGPPDSDCVPVSELVEGIATRLGVDEGAWVPASEQHAHEERELRLDPGKAAELLGWRTALSLSTALDWTVDWYRAHANGGDTAELCRAQVDVYTDMRPEGDSS